MGRRQLAEKLGSMEGLQFFNLGEVSSMFAWLWKQSSRNEKLM